MIKYFLENPDARAKYYENPDRAILEWLRLGAAQTLSSRITDNSVNADAAYESDDMTWSAFAGSYDKVNVSWSANQESGAGKKMV